MFDVLLENIKDFFREKRLIAILVSIGIFLFFTAVIVIFIQACPSKTAVPKLEDFNADQELIIPDGPALEKEYYQSRDTGSSWKDDEVKKWFTTPDGRSLEELKNANDGIAGDITGAAP